MSGSITGSTSGGSGSGSAGGSGSPTPGNAGRRIVDQIETFTLSGDAAVGSTVTGARGGDYVVLPGAPGVSGIFGSSPAAVSAAAATITVPEDGWYTINFRYANGSDSIGYRTLTVNGETVPGVVQFANRFAENNWGNTYARVLLEAGDSEIVLSNDLGAARGGVNATGTTVLLDEVTVEQGTSPSNQTSVRSLAMNNRTDMVGIVEAAQLYAKDVTAFGPALAELRYAANWTVDQIDYAGMWFRDVSAGAEERTFAPYFDSTLSFDERGIMTVAYGNYLPTGEALPVSVTHEYAMVPGFPLLVERVTLLNQNENGSPLIEWDVMDVMRLSPELQQQAAWDERRQAWIVELDQGDDNPPLYMAVGSFQQVSARGAGESGEDVLDGARLPFRPGQADPSESRGGTGVIGQFEGSGDVGGDSARASGTGLAIATEIESVDLYPTRPVELFYYTTIAESLEELDANIANALNPQQTSTPGSPTIWFDRTEDAWAEVLSRAQSVRGVAPADAVPGTPPETVDGATEREITDPALVTAYQRSLIHMLQAQQPEFGSFLAATNRAYEFKVWPRDGAATAISLDGAGLHDEAGRYWRWMASVEEDGVGEDAAEFPNGSFYTNYGFYQADQPIDFVQPEWDAQGLFLIGAYRHYEALRAAGREADAEAFVNDPVVREAVVDVANFIADRIEPNGFGPAEFSIWEEVFQYNTFTQVTYAAGLNAASRLAEAVGAADSADRWAGGAGTIRDAILRPTTAEPPGLWDEERGYLVQGILPNGQVNERLDASTNLAIVLGVLDADDPRALRHVDNTIINLSKNDYGISRYEGDMFYSASPFSPGGAYESRVDESAWPQMTSYVGMAKVFQDDPSWTLDSLGWTIARYGKNFSPPGEGVDWSTGEPMPSTMVEPVTAGWYIQNLLTYTGQYNPRLPDAGAAGA